MTIAYRYRASTPEGRVVEGVVRAPSQRTALAELRRQQLVPVDLSTVAEGSGARAGGALGQGPALALFARTVATLLAAGVALDRAVAFAAGQARHPRVAEAAREAHRALREGRGLAEALAGHPAVFGPLFVTMVAAGEESGALDESMARLADHLDELVELRARIRSALVYPALMAVVSGAGILVLLLFVVPRFARILAEEGGVLPLSTRMLVGASSALVGGWWILLLAAGVIALLTRRWVAQPENRRRWHRWRLTWPVLGDLELEHATARFMRALGMVLRSGRPVLPALRAAGATVMNAELRIAVERAAEAVSHGQEPHVALDRVLPSLATELMAVGVESGHLDELSLRVAEAYDRVVQRRLRTLVATVEPALILLFGALVGWVALAMLQAIYAVNTSLQ